MRIKKLVEQMRGSTRQCKVMTAWYNGPLLLYFCTFVVLTLTAILFSSFFSTQCYQDLDGQVVKSFANQSDDCGFKSC